MKIKDYIGKSFLEKSFRFYCDCLIKMNVTGKVINYKILSNEIILIVQTTEGKTIQIGLNTPNLQIDSIS